MKKVDFKKFKFKKIDFSKINLKKIMSSKKNIAIIAGVVVGIIILGIVIAILFSRDSQEKVLMTRMEELGKEFYEKFYYPIQGTTDEEKIAFAKKYETLGIKVSLDNLARYDYENKDEILEEFVNNKTKEYCDKTNSQVIIYPKEPYDISSYTIDVILECGFDKK